MAVSLANARRRTTLTGDFDPPPELTLPAQRLKPCATRRGYRQAPLHLDSLRDRGGRHRIGSTLKTAVTQKRANLARDLGRQHQAGMTHRQLQAIIGAR